jgi:hypothetical protein
MNKLIRLRDGSSLNVVGLCVLAVVLGVVVLVVVQAIPAISMYKHPPSAPSSARDSAAASKKFNDTIAWERAQVNGRSMFYKPLPPSEVAEDTHKATVYGGPSLLAFVNGTAWFSDGQKVSAKEPDGTSVRFVSARPPWSVRVRWQGGEFDVKLFEKTELSSLSSSTAYGVSWPSALSGSLSNQPRPEASGSEHSNVPPGPGASQPGANGEMPPPPPGPPPGMGGGGPGSGGNGEPSGSPPASPSPSTPPAPSPSPSPSPEPAPSPAPSQPNPQPAPSPAPPSEPGGSDTKPAPSHP